MKIGALKLFERTSARRDFNIAAWHWASSLTWSWILGVTFDGSTRDGRGAIRFGLLHYRNAEGWQATLALPFVVLHWHRQRPMFGQLV